jgi:hypothetical protein
MSGKELISTLKAFGVYLRKMRTYTCGNPLNME